MRRYAFIFLFIVVLVTPFLLKPLGVSAESPDTRADALPLIIVTPHVESIRREFAEAFSAWHQRTYGKPVDVDYRNFGGTSEIVKYFNASRGLYQALGTYQIDLVWGGGDFLFDVQLKGGGHLEGVTLDERLIRAAYPQPTLAGLPLYDPTVPPQWFGTALSSFGIAYNKDVIRHLGLPEPRTWSDLKDPRYRRWIVMADPTKSSSARSAFMVVVERAMADAAEQGHTEDAGWADGMGLLRQIAANARLFTDASSTIPGAIASGDVGAGMTIDFHARSTIEAVGEDRMGYVEPANATAMNPDPVALVRGAPNRQTAIHFIEFLLSPEGQRLWNYRAGTPGGPRRDSLRRLPIRRDVYDDMRFFTDKVNPFTAAATFNTSPARKKTFIILGELIEMSCMDLLEELRETRAAILASPRAVELDAQLGTFPFDQAEAIRRAAEWDRAAPGARLALKRRWTGEFRDEYRRLRQEARASRASLP